MLMLVVAGTIFAGALVYGPQLAMKSKWQQGYVLLTFDLTFKFTNLGPFHIQQGLRPLGSTVVDSFYILYVNSDTVLEIPQGCLILVQPNHISRHVPLLKSNTEL